MDKNTFKIIEGGMAGKTTPRGEIFKTAWVTDTRLMGVLCVGITWQNRDSVFNQFFYFDAEEYGFERYESIHHRKKHDDEEYSKYTQRLLIDTENSLIGGLGGNKVEISFEEAVHLVKSFLKFNKDNGIQMPDNTSDYIFIAELKERLTPR